MNSSLTTLEHPVSVLSRTPVLARNGFTCTLLTLAPESETVLHGSHPADEQLLVVVDGDIAVHTEGLTTIVNRGGAILLKPGRLPVLSARSGEPSRVMHVEIPPRQLVSPQITTLRP